ncbi:UTRA domain-containing protein [Rhodobacteraceae bacterium CCMM004]|nr:UTRA domain-containing protein [Rhodobacteraceae bacterium CCMM004]
MTGRGPGWSAVRDRLHARILDRTYAPGAKLPRDADLADELGCARSTVQRAMRALDEAGLVERRRRGGTTVRADPVRRATFDIPVIRREVEGAGHRYGYVLRSRDRAEPPPAVARALGASAPMLRVRATHLADGRPYMGEDRWISLATVPEIAAVDLAAESANAWLVRHRPFDRCDLGLYASAADAEDAAVMDVAPGTALLIVERATFIAGAPITWVRAVTAPGYRLTATV